MKKRLDVAAYVDGVLTGDRGILARAITLVESARPADREAADAVLEAVLPRTGGAFRVGITGAPGVGKSTFIERFGLARLEEGRRLAVLAIDPSSARTKGSILGDKTRMGGLAAAANAFIRPSPAAGTLGGVARRTRESMLLCEAAGFDLIFVESVGVGQSEAALATMVDSFLLLVLPGGGDELQGIKRGILELADVVAINKADGDHRSVALRTQAEYAAALRILRGDGARWVPPVIGMSALDGTGVDEVWARLLEHRASLLDGGGLDDKRRSQRIDWMYGAIRARLEELFVGAPGMKQALAETERKVAAGEVSVGAAVEALLAKLGSASA